MKNRNCPNKDACWDYFASNCEGCAVGQEIEKRNRKIKRLQADKKRIANEERKRAVKEFAEKLRDKEFSVKIGAEWCAVVKSLDIDELVKEECGE